MDSSTESGFKDYKLKDVKFRAESGTSPVAHAYVLESVKDGSKQFFDSAGDLVGVEDRFGHVTKLSWKVVNGKHRLESVTSGWGSKLTVAYAGSSVTFTSPKRWGQEKAPQTVVGLSQGRIASVTDPAGEQTRLEWTTQGAGKTVVPSAVVSPAGARTEFAYREYEPRSGGVVAVSKFTVKGADGRTLLDPVTIDLDPDGANGGRNYTGCPQYCSDGSDRLENSGDGSFSYRVRFTQGDGQQVERSYNALHLQKSETVRVKQGSQTKDVARTEYTYPGESGESGGGAPPRVKDAPADYQMPSKVTATSIDPADPSRTKTVEATSEFDEVGRPVKQVQGGVETTTEYGANSIPLRTETRDTTTGSRQIVENTLTGDQDAIASSVTKAAKDGDSEPAVVSRQEFEYQDGVLAGEVAKTTVTGDPNAEGGDPGAEVTSTEASIDHNAEGVGRRSSTVTGADGVKTVSVSDLASGSTLSEKTGDLAETTTVYDVLDRPVKTTSPDGTVTTSSYETGAGGSTVTNSREADGYATRSVSDELGREIRQESNYRPTADDGRGQVLPEGEWRQTSTAEFNSKGQQVKTTDAGGRESETAYDAWGRPATVTGPDGAVVRTSQDDVAGTTRTESLPAGSDTPTVSSAETVDEQGNPVKAQTSYGDGTSGGVTETRYDAFGKPVSTDDSASPFITESAYTAAGLPETDTVTPKQEGTGTSASADYTLDAFGNKTLKTLSRGDQSVQGWKTSFDAAGRETSVSMPGDGGTTTTDYNQANGLVDSVTNQDGSVTHQRADQAGRPVESWTTAKDAPGEKREHVRTSYDPVTGKVSAQWFADDEAGTKISYRYGPDGKLAERVDPGGKKTTFTYTDDEKVASVTDHTGASTVYSYEKESGRMTGAVQSRAGKELARVSYEYDGAGRPVKVDRGNGVVSSYTFNDAGRPLTEKHTRAGGEIVSEHAYTYTDGQKLATDIATVRDHENTEQQTATAYAYNDQGQLTQSSTTQGATPGQGTLVERSGYTYDLAANLTEKKETTPATDGAEKTVTTGYAYDPTSRTTTITMDGKEQPQEYDQAGRLVKAADGTRHSYNTSGQLVETTAPDGTKVTHTYNPAGERSTQATRTPTGQENTLTYLPGTETDQNGTTAGYLTGLGRETRTLTTADGTSDTSYYLTNARRDTTHTLDTNGNTRSHTTYTNHGTPTTNTPGSGNPGKPAGRIGAITENPYDYAGQYTTPTGLQPLGKRWYNPKAAAFTAPDTPAAGMLNAYAFAIGDPVNHTDPTGQSPQDAWKSFQNSWFNKEVLGWEGMPYLDISLAFVGLAATIASGGTLAPVTIAAISLAATLPTAADQIATQAGKGFLPNDVRTALDITALAGGITGAITGAITAGPKAINKMKGWKSPAIATQEPPAVQQALVPEVAPQALVPEVIASSSMKNSLPTRYVTFEAGGNREQAGRFRELNRRPTALSDKGGTIYTGRVHARVVHMHEKMEMKGRLTTRRFEKVSWVTEGGEVNPEKIMPLEYLPKFPMVWDSVTESWKTRAYKNGDFVMFSLDGPSAP